MARPAKSNGSDWGLVKKVRSDGGFDWYARIVRFDANGKKRQFTEKADNKTHAKRLRDQLARTFEDSGERALEGNRMTFREFADDYRARKVTPPRYHLGRKVSGLRSHKHVEGLLKTLVEYFGHRRINEIRPADLEKFKQHRLNSPVVIARRGKGKNSEIERPRAIASVNREMTLLRTILNDAVRNGWLTRSPFTATKGLISIADENRRDRILSYDEETRLLAACDEVQSLTYSRNGQNVFAQIGGKRAHLRPVLIVALDTALRRGEILKLKWRDVDFAGRTIDIVALNTKTATARSVGMTPRVLEELNRLWEASPKDPEELVFGIKDTFKRSFASACRDAGIEEFKFHDCRHTAITRMIQAGLSPMEVMKVSGHTQPSTFARYVNPNTQAVQRIADVLAKHNASVSGANGGIDSLPTIG